MAEFNTTELPVFQELDKGIVHRDWYAHLFRFTHLLKVLKPTAQSTTRLLDVGCGNADLYECLWRNKKTPARYLGLDLRGKQVAKNQLKYPKANFLEVDLTKPYDVGTEWDVITSFEVIEHTNKKNGRAFLENIWRCCQPSTVVYLSTPNYDPKVGAAANHTYDGAEQEYAHAELQALLEEHFTVTQKWGTFASQRDYVSLLTGAQLELWHQLHGYYHQDVLSILFAPLFPEVARNCLWQLTPKF